MQTTCHLFFCWCTSAEGKHTLEICKRCHFPILLYIGENIIINSNEINICNTLKLRFTPMVRYCGSINYGCSRVIAINIVLLSRKRLSHESLITLALVSMKSNFSFSFHNQYPIGVMLIPLTLVKINSKKVKRKNMFEKFCNDICLNTYIQPVHKIIHVLYLMSF